MSGKVPRSKPSRPAPLRQRVVTKKEMVDTFLLSKYPDLSAEERIAIRQTMIEDKTSPAAMLLEKAITDIMKSKNYRGKPREERLQMAANALANNADIIQALRPLEHESKLVDMATRELEQQAPNPALTEDERIQQYLSSKSFQEGQKRMELMYQPEPESVQLPVESAMERSMGAGVERTMRTMPSGPTIVPAPRSTALERSMGRGVERRVRTMLSGPTIVPDPRSTAMERSMGAGVERTVRTMPSGPTIVPEPPITTALARQEYPMGGIKRTSEELFQRGQRPKVRKPEPPPQFGASGIMPILRPELPKPTAPGVLKAWKDMELNEEMSTEIGLERASDEGGARKRRQRADVDEEVGMDAEQMVPPRNYVAMDENLKAMERFEVGLPPAQASLLSAPNYLPPLADDGFDEEEEVPFQQSSSGIDPRGYTNAQQTDVLFLAEQEYDRARRTFLRTRKTTTPVELLTTIADMMAMDLQLVAQILADRTLLGQIRDLGNTEMFAHPAPYQEEKVPDAEQFARKADKMFSFFQGDSDIMEWNETESDVEASIGAMSTFDQAAALWTTGQQFGQGVSTIVESLPEGISAGRRLGETAFSVLRGLGHGAYHVAGGLAAIAGGNPAGMLEHGIGLGELLGELADTVKGSDESFAILGKLMSVTRSVGDLGSELMKLGPDLWNRIIPDRLAELSTNIKRGFAMAWNQRPGYNPPKMIALYDQDNVPQPDFALVDQDMASDLRFAGQRQLDSSHDGQTLAMEAVDTFIRVDEAERLPLADQPIDPSGQLVAYDEFTPSRDADIFTKSMVPSRMLKHNTMIRSPAEEKYEVVPTTREPEPISGKIRTEWEKKKSEWGWGKEVTSTKKAPLKQVELGSLEGYEGRSLVGFGEERKKEPPSAVVPTIHQQPPKHGGGKSVPMIEGKSPHVVRKHGGGLGGGGGKLPPPSVPHMVPRHRHPPPGPDVAKPVVGGGGGGGGGEDPDARNDAANRIPIWGQEEDDQLYTESGVQPWLPEQPRANANAFPMRKGADRATAIASAAMQNWQPDHEHPDDDMWTNPLMMDTAMELALRFHNNIEPDYPQEHWSDNPAFYTESAQAMGEGYLRGLQAGHATPQPMNPNFSRERAMNQVMVDINHQQGWCDVFPDAETQDRDDRTSYVDSRWPY